MAKGLIPIEDALPIARQIADALEAAHEAGVMHRDLKPANIKVRPDGTVFGPLQQFSRAVEALVTRVSPSVVQVIVTGYGPREGSRTDSDFVISRRRRTTATRPVLDTLWAQV